MTKERKDQNGTYTTIATYTYDDNGNLLTKTGADGTAAYTYNGFNQQTGYTVGTTTSAYAYNAKGIRTAKTIGANRTSYLLDGSNVVTEVKNNAVSANYIRGTNLISKEADNSTSYYLYNAHGDVIGLTNNTGSATKTYDYDAFGIEKNPNAADTNPFRYCGEYYDTETGKYYLRARYYDPSLGRFTQADSVRYVHRELPNGASIIDPLSLNLYAYSANNPIKYCDPSGNAWDIVFDAISAGMSFVDFVRNPSVANAAYFAYDLCAAAVPFLPASYMAKGLKLIGIGDKALDFASMLSKAESMSDTAEALIKNRESLVMGYKELKKLVKKVGIKGYEVHHLIEKRFASKLGLDADDILSVMLDKDTHRQITNDMRTAIGYLNDKTSKTTYTANAQEIWKAIVDVYKDNGMTEYLSVLKKQIETSPKYKGGISDWLGVK